MAKTRKRRITGALGEGFYGITYNSRSNTLYSQIDIEQILSIRLHTKKRDIVLRDKKSIMDFLSYLQSHSDFAVKTFKTTYALTGTKQQDNFQTELNENRTLLKLYGPNANTYLTVYPIKGFRQLELMGASIHLKSRQFYMIFGHRCNNVDTFKAEQMLIDILESLVILQKNSYLHNDIKLENVVHCDKRYKLIDWGQAGPSSELYIGDMIGTSPIKWHLMGLPDVFSTKMMEIRTQMVDFSFKFSELFREVHTQVQKEYYEVISTYPFYETLAAKFILTFDVFMLGMLLLRAIHKFHLNKQKLLPIVKRFVSLHEPLTAKDALTWLRKN